METVQGMISKKAVAEALKDPKKAQELVAKLFDREEEGVSQEIKFDPEKIYIAFTDTGVYKLHCLDFEDEYGWVDLTNSKHIEGSYLDPVSAIEQMLESEDVHELDNYMELLSKLTEHYIENAPECDCEECVDRKELINNK